MQWILVPFGFVFIVVAAVTIGFSVVRRTEILTIWNLFLLGAINFAGLAAIGSGQTTQPYAYYSDDDYVRFVLGGILLFALMYVSYYGSNWARRVPERHLRKWPPLSGTALAGISVLCMVMSLGVLMPFNVQGIGQWLIIFGMGGSIIGAVCLVYGWSQNPSNVFWLLWAGVATLLASWVAITGTTGRRGLLSVATAIALCLYWTKWRKNLRLGMVVKTMIAAFCVFAVINAYNAVRHREKSANLITADFAWETVKMIPGQFISPEVTQGMIGSDAVEASLVAINRHSVGGESQPFGTLWFVISNPIPRVFWEEKPELLGSYLPRTLGVWRKTGYVNWGVGLVGQAYYEGGYLMVAFYAVFFGISFRLADEFLKFHAGNPYLLGTMGAFSGQIIAFSRGDAGLFIVIILGAMLTGLIVRAFGRIAFGSMVYPVEGAVPVADGLYRYSGNE